MNQFQTKTPGEQLLLLATRAIELATRDGEFHWRSQCFIPQRGRADFEGIFANRGASYPVTATCLISLRQKTGILVLSAVSQEQKQFNVSFDADGEVSLKPKDPTAVLPVFGADDTFCANRPTVAVM